MDKTFKQIEVINYEAQQFLIHFSRFRDRTHAIDQTLCSNLLSIVSEIDSFLDSKPKEVIISPKDQITPNQLDKFGIRRDFICKRCNIEFGSSLDNVRVHLKSGRHFFPTGEHRPKNGIVAPKPKQETKALPKKAKTLIQGSLQAFFTNNIPVAKKLTNLTDYSVIENDLLTLIQPAFPERSIKLYLFGSRISGIGCTYSDLDIFIDIDNAFNQFENRASQRTIDKLKAVQKLLQNDPKWLNLIAIPHARVPILTIFHKTTTTACDIGFSNGLGFCNTKLTQYLLELQPLVQALCLFMKKWLEKTKLNEHITSYSMTLLIVSYFQSRKVLPSIEELQKGLEDPVEIGPWLAAFAAKSLDDLAIPEANCVLDNFKKELKLFFQHYSTFDFEHNLICPYLGYSIRMENLESSPLLPRYVKYMETRKEVKDAQFKKSFMNVQDPFQMNHNVTKAVPVIVVRLLKQYFELSANLLTDTITSPYADDGENLKK